jgi:hypothetical protein
MGEHRNNPRAIEAAKPAERFPPGAEIFNHQFEVAIELNKEKTAEMVAIVDAAKSRGEEPRFALPKWDPTVNPEWFDYVVYNQAVVARPSPLAIDPRKIPAARIRLGEQYRFPLKELRDRTDAAFANHEARGSEH